MIDRGQTVHTRFQAPFHVWADLIDNAAHLVPQDTRQLHFPGHARGPVVDLHIRAANPGGGNFQADFPRPRPWLGMFRQGDAARARFNLG